MSQSCQKLIKKTLSGGHGYTRLTVTMEAIKTKMHVTVYANLFSAQRICQLSTSVIGWAA